MDVEKPEPGVPVSSVFVTNERACSGASSSHRLRNRNRSQDSASSCVQLAKDFVAIRRKIGDIEGDDCLQSTPKGDVRKPDGSGLAYSPEDSGYTSRGKSLLNSFIPEDSSPFQKGRSRLFDVGESDFDFRPFLKPQVWLPFVVVFVVLASSIVAILSFNSAMGGGDGRVANGKYRSIEFAHSRMRRDVVEDATRPPVVLDEDGEAIGGKKAAIKFGYDLKRNRIVEEEGDGPDEDHEGEAFEDDDEEDVVITDSEEFIEELRKFARSKAELADDEKNRQLLEKIRSFGRPFSTSVVKPLDLDGGNAKAAGKKRPKKRSPKSPNKPNPFRFRKNEMSKPKTGENPTKGLLGGDHPAVFRARGD